jgi:hypothetical protein
VLNSPDEPEIAITSLALTNSPWAFVSEALCLYTVINWLPWSIISTNPESDVQEAKITLPSAAALTGVFLGTAISTA